MPSQVEESEQIFVHYKFQFCVGVSMVNLTVSDDTDCIR